MPEILWEKKSVTWQWLSQFPVITSGHLLPNILFAPLEQQEHWPGDSCPSLSSDQGVGPWGPLVCWSLAIGGIAGFGFPRALFFLVSLLLLPMRISLWMFCWVWSANMLLCGSGLIESFKPRLLWLGVCGPSPPQSELLTLSVYILGFHQKLQLGFFKIWKWKCKKYLKITNEVQSTRFIGRQTEALQGESACPGHLVVEQSCAFSSF